MAKVFKRFEQQMDELGILFHVPQERTLRLAPADSMSATPTASSSSIPFVGPCWMDDLCVCLKADTNVNLMSAMSTATGAILDIFQCHAMTPNLKPGKTALLVAPRGPGTQQWKVRLFGPLAPSTQQVLGEHHTYEVPIVRTYTHLGGLVHFSGSLKQEIRTRLATAHQAFTTHRKLLYHCPSFSLEKKRELFRSLVLSKLLYGAETWILSDQKSKDQLHGGIIHLYKRLLHLKRDAHVEDAEVLFLAGLPSPTDLLRMRRLRYLGSLFAIGETACWGLLNQDEEWTALVADDLRWVWAQLHHCSDLGDPDHHLPRWLEIIQWHRGYWKRLLRRAEAHAIGLQARQFQVGQAQMRLLERLATHDFIQYDSPRLHRPGPAHQVYGCMSCAIACRSLGGEGAHMHRAHGVVNAVRHLIGGTQCGACLTEYYTHGKLKAHLLRAHACRRALIGRRQWEPLSAGIGSAEDEHRRALHDNRHRPLPAHGPLREPVVGRDFSIEHIALFEQIAEIIVEDNTPMDLHARLVACIRSTTISWTHCQKTLREVEEQLVRDQRQHAAPSQTEDDNVTIEVLRQLQDPMQWPCLHDYADIPLTSVPSLEIIDAIIIEAKVKDHAPQVPRPVGRERIFLHAFSGRRRPGDLQHYMETAFARDSESLILHVISMDVVIDSVWGDARNQQTKDFWLHGVLCGFVLGGLCGPPCETWSQARYAAGPEDQPHRRQPRPVRSAQDLWGLLSLSLRELQQVASAEKQGEVRVSEAQAAVLKELEEWKDRCSRLQADKEAEEDSRVEMQRLHAQVTEDAAKLRDDQEKLKATLASEVRAKEQFQRQHEAVVQDMDKLKSDQAELSKDQEAEKRARLLAEQKHAASLQDMERMRSDQERLQADKMAEQAARQKVEQEHQAVLQDMERVRADHQRVTREKEDEARLRQEAERKHAEVQRDLNKVKDDQRRLQSDKEAEERAKLEVQRLHQAVLDEKNSLHGNHTHLQELLSAEKKAKDEMQRRHTMVENDKQKILRDQAELQEAKAREEKLKMEAERQHQKLLQDMEKLRQDQAQLNADKEDEKRAKEEAERKHASVLRDMQQLQADRDKLQADQIAEKRAREEAERKHAEVLQDRDKIAADMRQLQSDKDSEQRAKQEIERKHDAAMKQMELVNADQTKLKMDKDSEVQTRLDMEAKHQAVLRDLEQLRAEKDQIAIEHNNLKMEHQRLEAERNRLHASHAEASRGQDEAIGRLRAAHETELKQTKDQSQQHKQEWEGRHQSLLQELEGLRVELRRAQQDKEDERRAKERAQADRQSASRQSEALQVQVQSIQSRRNSDLSSLEDVQSRVRSLQSENEMLTGDVNTLKKLKQEKEEAEKDLREAFNIQRTELKTIQRQLEDREQQVKEFEEWRKNLEDKYSGLLSQLSAEKKEGEDLRRELREAQATGEQLQRNAQEALDRLLLLQQENEDLKESLESKTRGESEALKRRMTMPRMSLWAVPPVLAIEEEADLLPHSKDEFIAQVRDAHRGVDSLMQSAAEVHIRTISAQVDGAAAAESKGTGIRRGLADYEKQYEIQSERRSELNNLEARLHDLRALKEEATRSSSRFLELHPFISQDHILISIAGIAFTVSVPRVLQSLDVWTKTGQVGWGPARAEEKLRMTEARLEAKLAEREQQFMERLAAWHGLNVIE
eukprot:s1844_g8.t1